MSKNNWLTTTSDSDTQDIFGPNVRIKKKVTIHKRNNNNEKNNLLSPDQNNKNTIKRCTLQDLFNIEPNREHDVDNDKNTLILFKDQERYNIKIFKNRDVFNKSIVYQQAHTNHRTYVCVSLCFLSLFTESLIKQFNLFSSNITQSIDLSFTGVRLARERFFPFLGKNRLAQRRKLYGPRPSPSRALAT